MAKTKKALCPLCGKRHNVNKDYWLVNKWEHRALLQQFVPSVRDMAFMGYETWFWCDSQIGRYYITKYYDEQYRYMFYTTVWLDTDAYK